MYNRWTRDDDERLWEIRSKPTEVLAVSFGRSKGGIRSRLKHLQNPNHAAYQRLFGPSQGAHKSLNYIDKARKMLATAPPEANLARKIFESGPQQLALARNMSAAEPHTNSWRVPGAASTSVLTHAHSFSSVDRNSAPLPIQNSSHTNQNPRDSAPLNSMQKRILQLVLR